MKLRLQEIEFDSKNPRKARDFYDYVLDIDTMVNEEKLAVLNSGTMGLDFAPTPSFPSKVAGIVVYTSNLEAIMNRLDFIGTPYILKNDTDTYDPYLVFRDPDGFMIHVYRNE